jgi:gluconokinase
MAKQSVVLAIDVGTSSVRALVCDTGGNALAGSETQIKYDLDTTQDGGAEFPAEALFAIMAQAIDTSIDWADPDDYQFIAVGITSFWHSLLGLDATGTPVTPVYFWADSRADATIDALGELVARKSLRQRTGCRLHSSYWPAKLFWLRSTEPARFDRVARWVGFTEYAAQRLTGQDNAGMSVSMASGTGMLDVHAVTWDQHLLETLNLPIDHLPGLIDVKNHGVLGGEFSDRWPLLAGVPWMPALGDGACANVGSGAIGGDRIGLTLGTSGAMRLILPAPAGEEWPVPPGLWAYRLDRDHAVIGGALSNGGNVRRWVLELTGLSPAEAITAASEGTADDHGLTVLPFVAGERSPGWHPHANAVITGLTLATTPTDLLRATMESVAYRLARIYSELLPIASPTHQIVGNGGAIVSSPEWTAIIASALGHEILALPAGDEATARGAALMALWSVGVYTELDQAPDPAALATPIPPDDEAHARYLIASERQRALESLIYPEAN